MYVDGVCEVEEGLFSETIAFEDTSYQSTRDDIQKGIFSSMCRLYDQFGADTLVQMSVINTPIPSSEIGSRQFFDPMKQDSANASEDAALFNEILNQKLRQGVSNIRRDRYITFSVLADNVEEAMPKLARIETETQRILSTVNSSSRVVVAVVLQLERCKLVGFGLCGGFGFCQLVLLLTGSVRWAGRALIRARPAGIGLPRQLPGRSCDSEGQPCLRPKPQSRLCRT